MQRYRKQAQYRSEKNLGPSPSTLVPALLKGTDFKVYDEVYHSTPDGKFTTVRVGHPTLRDRELGEELMAALSNRPIGSAKWPFDLVKADLVQLVQREDYKRLAPGRKFSKKTVILHIPMPVMGLGPATR